YRVADGVEIARGEDLVEAIGHDRRERRAIRPRAIGNGTLYVGLAPVADAGFLVRRNVGAPHLIGRPVPLLRTARELPIHGKNTPRTTRSVAIAAGQDSVDQVAAALDRRLRLRQRLKSLVIPILRLSDRLLPSRVARWT